MIELADIIAPITPPPAPLPYAWIALGVALLLLVSFFVLQRWLQRTRPQRLARAALKRTERDLHSSNLDARAAVFQIARAVRCFTPPPPLPFKGRDGVGMGENTMNLELIPHLTSPLKGEERKSHTLSLMDEWAEFTQTLDRARFSSEPIDTPQAMQLLSEARRWIAHVA